VPLFLFLTRFSFTFFFLFNDPPTTDIYTLSLHDALPICSFHGAVPANGKSAQRQPSDSIQIANPTPKATNVSGTSPTICPGGGEIGEHTSELQSPYDLVCRLLLEKKKKNNKKKIMKIRIR